MSFKDPGPVWHLLAEYVPSGENESRVPAEDWVITVIQRLGLESKQLESIQRDVTRSLDSARRKLRLAGEPPRVPVCVWVSGPGNTASGRFRPQEGFTPGERHGWGFFLTTRIGEPEKGKLWCFVDLYLYFEGRLRNEQARSGS